MWRKIKISLKDKFNFLKLKKKINFFLKRKLISACVMIPFLWPLIKSF